MQIKTKFCKLNMLFTPQFYFFLVFNILIKKMIRRWLIWFQWYIIIFEKWRHNVDLTSYYTPLNLICSRQKKNICVIGNVIQRTKLRFGTLVTFKRYFNEWRVHAKWLQKRLYYYGLNVIIHTSQSNIGHISRVITSCSCPI